MYDINNFRWPAPTKTVRLEPSRAFHDRAWERAGIVFLAWVFLYIAYLAFCAARYEGWL